MKGGMRWLRKSAFQKNFYGDQLQLRIKWKELGVKRERVHRYGIILRKFLEQLFKEQMAMWQLIITIALKKMSH